MKRILAAAVCLTAAAASHAHAQSLSGREIGRIMYDSSVVLVADKCPGLAATRRFVKYAHQLDNVPEEIRADIQSKIAPQINRVVEASPGGFCRAAFQSYGPNGTVFAGLLMIRE
jgi:hypothetical protein